MDLTKEIVPFCERFLKIETKEGTVEPFILNPAQLYLHERLEQQKKEKGFVRTILIKGRQQGCSTYIIARFYHRAIFNPGTKVFILSHEAKTTSALFKKVKKYQNCIEDKFINMAPKVISSNNNQLVFEDALGSEYSIGTAGNKFVGRGFTIQLLHLSEAAFYENPEDIEKGLVQTVADVKNTEIIYETTANGQNFLYTKIREIMDDPTSPYQIIFIPWFWQSEYTVLPENMPDNFEPTEEELGYKLQFQLTDNQLMWRRRKIQALKSISAFKQEYPFTIEEAFEFSGDSLVKAEKVNEARKNNFEVNNLLPIIMGVDAARSGDRTIFIIRQGRKIIHWAKFKDMKEDKLLSLIAEHMVKFKIDMTFVDAAHASGAVDFLHSMGYKNKVVAVYFNSGANNPDLYLNKRAEMMCAVADWFDEDADIPDDQEIADDILSIPGYKLSSTHKRQIVSKEEIKKILGKSTDIMDALALTFAYPVMKENALNLNKNMMRPKERISKITSLNLKRGVR